MSGTLDYPKAEMAKPRTFVSSTCLDLKDARAALESHLSILGHEPLLSDTLTFGVTPSKHSHQACLDQVDNADYFILVIGGRHGGTYIGSERSITNEEYRRAMKRQIPVMIFVSEEVDVAARIYRKNPKADVSDMVDDTRIFDFVDLVRSESRDNWVRLYKNVEDIKRAITAQLAYICLLYSQQTRKPASDRSAEAEVVRPFPKSLNISEHKDPASAAALISGLKAVHATISRIQQGQASGKEEKLKLMWIFARHAEVTGRRGRTFSMKF